MEIQFLFLFQLLNSLGMIIFTRKAEVIPFEIRGLTIGMAKT